MISALLIAHLLNTATATTLTSSVMIDVSPTGERSFLLAGTCSNVKDALLPLERVDEIKTNQNQNLKIAIRSPSPADTVSKGRSYCRYTCPNQTSPVPIGNSQTNSILLACVGATEE